MGDDAGGAKPNTEGHDPERVAATRRVELAESCRILGVGSLTMLGYHDSGMAGWAENDAPGSFWSLDVAEAAKPLVALIEERRPQVLVTYDANGFYGHPDHIQAHRIAIYAAEATGIPEKIYFPTFPRSVLPAFVEALLEAEVEMPEPADASADARRRRSPGDARRRRRRVDRRARRSSRRSTPPSRRTPPRPRRRSS